MKTIKLNKVNKILFVDTETTGLPENYEAPTSDSDNWPRLVQFSWIITDKKGNQLEQRDFVIKPNGFVIPEESTRIHGITNEYAKENGVDLEDAMMQFMKDLKDVDIIIGHNISFDMRIIGAEQFRLYKNDYIANMPNRCTMKESVNYCKLPKKNNPKEYKWPSLKELHFKLFNHLFENAHNSLADITATKDCFFKLKELGVMK